MPSGLFSPCAGSRTSFALRGIVLRTPAACVSHPRYSCSRQADLHARGMSMRYGFCRYDFFSPNTFPGPGLSLISVAQFYVDFRFRTHLGRHQREKHASLETGQPLQRILGGTVAATLRYYLHNTTLKGEVGFDAPQVSGSNRRAIREI